MRRKGKPDYVRTIYDDGAEEVGRKQLDLETLGGSPETLHDDDDVWGEGNETSECIERNLSRQARLAREKRNNY